MKQLIKPPKPRKPVQLIPLQEKYQRQLAEIYAKLPAVKGGRRIDSLADELEISRITLIHMMKGEGALPSFVRFVENALDNWNQMEKWNLVDTETETETETTTNQVP